MASSDFTFNKNNFQKFEDEDITSQKVNREGSIHPSNQTGSTKKGLPKFAQGIAKEEIISGGVGKHSNQITQECSQTTIEKVTVSLNFIGQYFNVEVDDIKLRIVSALTPFNKGFYTLAESKPDLYGPFWIYTTLIFIVSFAGNLSNYLTSTEKESFTYNFNFVPTAACCIYGFGFGIPMLVFVVMRYIFKVEISVVLSVCLYGYSFAILGPILLLCLIPVDIVETILLMYFLVHSGFFVVFNMWKLIYEKAVRSKYIILGILLLFHIILFLALKFYFFSTAIEIKKKI